MSFELDNRKKRILQAIIKDYIFTAEPVGSRTIARKYGMGVSPATIRNEMADLEEMGFLEQPHTSAGRIPSERGYRYYVDCLMQKEKLSFDEEDLIQREYRSKIDDVGQVIHVTGQLLSQLTSYTAVVQKPKIGFSSFKNIQLLGMDKERAMLVAVMDNGIVQHRMIEVPGSITGNDLAAISAVLNAKLSGFTMESIKNTLIKEIYIELASYRRTLDLVLDVLRYSLASDNDDKIYLGGLFNILNQPEFQNVEKLKTLLGLLEQEDLLSNLMAADLSNSGVTVRIGGEISYQGMQDCSMVMAIYGVKGQPIGSLGVLGPTRMDYSKVISVVEYMTRKLSFALENLFKGLVDKEVRF